MDRNNGRLATVNNAKVALRKESVDRNYIIKITDNRPAAVALRKESVDRNLLALAVLAGPFVALRKESVDRNLQVCIIT